MDEEDRKREQAGYLLKAKEDLEAAHALFKKTTFSRVYVDGLSLRAVMATEGLPDKDVQLYSKVQSVIDREVSRKDTRDRYSVHRRLVLNIADAILKHHGRPRHVQAWQLGKSLHSGALTDQVIDECMRLHSSGRVEKERSALLQEESLYALKDVLLEAVDRGVKRENVLKIVDFAFARKVLHAEARARIRAIEDA